MYILSFPKTGFLRIIPGASSPEKDVYLAAMQYFFSLLGSNISQSANLSLRFTYLTKVVIVMDTYYIPVIVCYGIASNSLSALLLLCSRSCRGSHKYWPYIVGMAMTDSMFLLSLLAVWLETVFGFRLYNGDGWCQAVTCLSSISGFLSLWYAVALSVDRFLYVFFPGRRGVLTTSARAKVVCLGLFWLAVPVYLNMSIISGAVKTSHGITFCVKLRRFQSAMRVLSKIDLFLNVFVAYAGIILINIAIGFRLINSFTVGRRQRMCEAKRLGSPSSVRVEMNYVKKRSSVVVGGGGGLSHFADQTIVPLIVVLLFVALNLPAHLFETYVVISNLAGAVNGTQISAYILQKTLMILWYSRMATTFLTLVVFDQSFRRHLVAILPWDRRRNVREDVTTIEFPVCEGTEDPVVRTTTL